MDLKTYFTQHTQQSLADRLKVRRQMVNAWATGAARIGAQAAIRIEQATDGEITRGDLRPDLWPPA